MSEPRKPVRSSCTAGREHTDLGGNKAAEGARTPAKAIQVAILAGDPQADLRKLHVQVVMGLQKEPGFLPELFRRLEAGPSDPAWGDLLAFLQEMCGLAKHLQPSNCTALMSRLHQLGLFQVCVLPMLGRAYVS